MRSTIPIGEYIETNHPRGLTSKSSRTSSMLLRGTNEHADLKLLMLTRLSGLVGSNQMAQSM
jgi:hypothetical protein